MINIKFFVFNKMEKKNFYPILNFIMYPCEFHFSC